MKNKLLFLITCAIIVSSCSDKIEKLREMEYAFFIFRFSSEANKELIITCPCLEDIHVIDSTAGFGMFHGIYNFPKRYRNEPYYAALRWTQEPEKYSYYICEFATEEKLLALHDGYFTYFPYTNLIENDFCVVRDGKWNDICNCNPLDLPILGSPSTSSPLFFYKEIRFFRIGSLEKITHKSRHEMTIDDIENAINKVIDEGKLDKYSKTYNNMWASKE